MSTTTVVLISVGVSLAYLASIGVAWALFCTFTDWDEEEGCIAAAVFWPIVLPPVGSGWVAKWAISRKRVRQSRLATAKVVKS